MDDINEINDYIERKRIVETLENINVDDKGDK